MKHKFFSSLLPIVFLLPLAAHSQDARFKKLDTYYVTDKFVKCIDAAMGFTEKNDKTKMGGYAREINKAFPDDGVMSLLSGSHLVLSGNAGDGFKLIDTAYKQLSVDTARQFSETEAPCVSKYFIAYTNYLL